MIDSHPYENVDGDGRPLCHKEDEITPDYETIFVKQSDEESKQAVMKNAGDIDVILSQRMSQKSVTGNSDGTSSPPPPQPPPKQRTPVETGAIDSRKVAVTPDDGDSSSERLSSAAMFLYDPPISNGDAAAPGTQKIKKGDLRLTQMENGSWRLEDSDKPQPSSTATTTETASTTTTTSTTTSTKLGGKKKKSKDQSNDDNTGSEQQQLLRRPSIKKIRALFQKDKDTSTSSTSSKNDSGESEENKEVLAAISKLPKFEPAYGNIVGRSESTSMPNSLDRRTGSKSSVLPTAATTITTSTTSSKVLSSSENKPSLPVKRSKSMKAISKPVSFLFPSNTSVPTTAATNNNKQLFKSNSLYLDNFEPPTRSDTFPKNSSVSRFDFENLGNLPRRESAGKELGNVTNFEQQPAANVGLPPPKPMRSNSEYANVYMQQQQPSSDFVSADSVRHRISNYVSSNKSSLSKPDSSNSLNEDAKKMLKDCQDYLVQH